MLTFIEERRRRIMKAREEGRAEGREEGRAEIFEALNQNPRIAAILWENPRIRETLKELGIDPSDSENGGG